MRYLFLFLSLLFVNTVVRAQAHVYDDLLILYVDEEYIKCLDKADRYIDKDDTRRDALPYLYKSLCSHEMSKLDKYTSDPEFKYAARDALKYAAKYRKKDKNMEFFNNYEDYWAELNTTAMETGFALMEEESYSKAKRQYQRMTTYYPENPGAWQMLALSQFKMKLARDAAESLKAYEKALAAVPDLDRLPKDQQRLLRESMIRYADYLDEQGMRDSARAVLAPGAEQFSENPEFKGLLDELN